MKPDLDEMLEPIAFLLGTWRGRGEGVYPTIEPFSYKEEAVFTHTGRPFLVYSSKTWSADDGRPMHAESGFIRSIGDDRLEFVIAHAFGITEIGEGSVSHQSLQSRSTDLVGSGTAKRVDAVWRVLDVADDVLRYEIGMAYGGHELQNHLNASLEKAS